MADHTLVWEPSARDTMDWATKNLQSQNRHLMTHEMKLTEFGFIRSNDKMYFLIKSTKCSWSNQISKWRRSQSQSRIWLAIWIYNEVCCNSTRTIQKIETQQQANKIKSISRADSSDYKREREISNCYTHWNSSLEKKEGEFIHSAHRNILSNTWNAYLCTLYHNLHSFLASGIPILSLMFMPRLIALPFLSWSLRTTAKPTLFWSHNESKLSFTNWSSGLVQALPLFCPLVSGLK